MNYINLKELRHFEQWNETYSPYGSAIRISKKVITFLVVSFLIITPGTNWLIPVAIKKIKRGLTIRW